MAIKNIEILNVMAFQRQLRKNDRFRLNFSDGINVVIGENGVGKSTLLKMIYAAAQCSGGQEQCGRTDVFTKYFSSQLRDEDLLKSKRAEQEDSYFSVSDGEHKFKYSLSARRLVDSEGWLGLNIPSVFIPTTEMLSHSKGFLALNQKYKLPFDGTQIDIIVNASLPETREISEIMQGVLDKISRVIDGEVIQEDDTFYIMKRDGRKLEFSLEAEGLRKLAMLWKLIRNGLLEEGTILLWDEPEANLNPELYPLVAEILLELEKNGVQMFVATHSYNFAKYLELRRTKKEQVQFHNLYKDNPEMKEYSSESDEIYTVSAYSMEELKQNHIILADNKLLDEVYGL